MRADDGIRLWIDNEAAELHALMWEQLHHMVQGAALPVAISADRPFSRYVGLERQDPSPIAERPMRMLLAVANPAAVGQVTRLQTGLERQGLAKCNYFRLELLDVQDELELTTSGESFHALTVIEGEAEIITPGGMCRLGQYATALVPAACQAYRVRPEGRVKALLATGAA